MRKRHLVRSLLFFPLTFLITISFANNFGPYIDQQKILANAPGLDSQALKYAVKGYWWALENHEVSNRNVLTIIDFNKPSDEKRVWVINLVNSRVLLNTYTTQGKNSGGLYATRFSNRCQSNETSLGVYKTLNTYYGKHGLSERLQGLEPGINNNAFRRDIVVHPASYASARYVSEFDAAGRSWGCFGISPAVSNRFVELTKDGSIIFAYASQERGDRYI